MTRGFGEPGFFAVHTHDHQRRNVLHGARPEDLRHAIAAARSTAQTEPTRNVDMIQALDTRPGRP